MVTNSREGSSSATYYSTNTNNVNGFYYSHGQASGACPTGWHLPDQGEWTLLKDWVNSNKTSEGAKFWVTSGGNAFAGYRDYVSSWVYWGTRGRWWSSVSDQYFYSRTGGVSGPNALTVRWMSVRCVKN